MGVKVLSSCCVQHSGTRGLPGGFPTGEGMIHEQYHRLVAILNFPNKSLDSLNGLAAGKQLCAVQDNATASTVGVTIAFDRQSGSRQSCEITLRPVNLFCICTEPKPDCQLCFMEHNSYTSKGETELCFMGQSGSYTLNTPLIHP